MQAVNLGRQRFSARYHLCFRLFNAFLFLGVLSIIITLSIVYDLYFMDLIVCCLAFLPTGWGLILVSLVEVIVFFGHLFPGSFLTNTFVSSDFTSCEAEDREYWTLVRHPYTCSSL
jgi:hypothetical protein